MHEQHSYLFLFKSVSVASTKPPRTNSMLGLEHYLGMDELPPSPSSGDVYRDSEPSSDDSEIHSQVPAIPFPSQITSNGLMMLLSGNQNLKRTKRTKESLANTSFDDLIDANLNTSTIIDVEEEASFGLGPEKSIQSTLRDDEIMALEQRIYSSAQSVSALNLLQKPSKPLSEPESSLIEEPTGTVALENKFTAARSVDAKNLFLSFAPKSMKNKKGEWTLKVRLKINPEKLAAIKPTKHDGLSVRSKPTLIVTIKLPVSALKEIKRMLNPLFTRSSGSTKGKNAKNVFAMMMKTATQNAMPKLTDLQKLTGLLPPSIKRCEMHVCDTEDAPLKPTTISLPKRSVSLASFSTESMEQFVSKEINMQNNTALSFSKEITNEYVVEALIASNAPMAYTSAPHRRIYEKFILEKVGDSENLPWPQKFQPPSLDFSLVSEDSRYFLKKWILNSFAILKTQSTRTPRNVKKREQMRRQKKKQDPMADFVVDDFEDSGYETEEDVYQPVLIIEGEIGSGKTSSVYAAMNALDGYVHEINSGQQRSRKDLHSSLKELCTTQIIHQNQEGRSFQKGLVLFEDCDILFDQDKTFWNVVSEVINYSRRPIVLTVRDSSVVPRAIWELANEQSSIQSLIINDRESLTQYLWLCCLAHHCLPSHQLLSKTLDECITSTGFDVRKALMDCQLFCSGRQSADDSYYMIDLKTKPPSRSIHSDISTLSKQLDTMSVADLLKEKTSSSLLHAPIDNELLDIYIIDNSHLLRQSTLPHELNIGEAIEEVLQAEKNAAMHNPKSFNSIRYRILDFIASRAKKVPLYLQDVYNIRATTRSRSSSEMLEEPDVQGLPDTSVCYCIPKNAFLLELAPFARDWAHFQKSLHYLEAQAPVDSNQKSLLDILRWREFYDNVDKVLETI